MSAEKQSARFNSEPRNAVGTTPSPSDQRADAILDRWRSVIPEIEWGVQASLIERIRRLKKQRRAVILAHNYQTPEIFYGVADFTGDSLGLARQGAASDAEVIVLCGVHFMAETAKILSPEKTVLLPDQEAGCSLASSLAAGDVRQLRERYPGVPVVSYVNTSAAVKAESDICCTSANAVEVVQSLDSDRVILLPDEYLGDYVARHSGVEIIRWEGHCEVHERFSAEEVRGYRQQHPGIQVLAHPECSSDVLMEADFVGSTSGMIRHLESSRPERVVLVTECSMSDNLALELPEIQFVRPCNLCPHMKLITLPKIAQALEALEPKVEVPAAIAGRARQALQAMLGVSR